MKKEDEKLFLIIAMLLVGGLVGYSIANKNTPLTAQNHFWTSAIAKEPRLVLAQMGPRNFLVSFDDCAAAPESISQLLVSSTKNNYADIKSKNGGCSISLDFSVPTDVHEFWVSRDQWYTLDQAIVNYPNNSVLHVMEQAEPPAPGRG